LCIFNEVLIFIHKLYEFSQIHYPLFTIHYFTIHYFTARCYAVKRNCYKN